MYNRLQSLFEDTVRVYYAVCSTKFRKIRVPEQSWGWTGTYSTEARLLITRPYTNPYHSMNNCYVWLRQDKNAIGMPTMWCVSVQYLKRTRSLHLDSLQATWGTKMAVASLWGALEGPAPSKTLGRGHNPLVEDRLLCKFIHRAM